MRHLLLTASLGAALAACSFSAHAGNADPNNFFINASAGMSHSNVDGLTDKNSWGYGLNFGYRWHDTARLGAFFSKSKVTASGGLQGEDSDNDVNVYVGAGIAYDVSPNFSLGLNIDRYQAKAKRFITGTNSPLMASATLEWRFGQ